jgi:hypothetical protein
MKNHDFLKFINTETKIIEISKWIAGEKMGCDPGQPYISDWIEKHSMELRAAWNLSKCKTCKKGCLHNLRVYCEEYEEDPDKE